MSSIPVQLHKREPQARRVIIARDRTGPKQPTLGIQVTRQLTPAITQLPLNNRLARACIAVSADWRPRLDGPSSRLAALVELGPYPAILSRS
jgi:hypothetical protein